MTIATGTGTETAREESSSRTVVAGVALLLSVLGATALGIGAGIGFLTPATETVFTALALAGWLLLVWAALLGGVAAVGLVRSALARRRSAPLPSALVIATGVVIATVLIAQPLVGSSGAVG
jgi:hypothetical protein